MANWFRHPDTAGQAVNLDHVHYLRVTELIAGYVVRAETNTETLDIAGPYETEAAALAVLTGIVDG